MKYVIIALMSGCCLSACAAAGFDEDAARLRVPDVVKYSLEKQNQVADEMESCDAPATMDLLKDYCVMRDQARIARGKKPQCAVSK